MKNRKQIKTLEAEIELMREDYQHTHDTLWRVLRLICDEYGMNLEIRPRDGSDRDDGFDVLAAAARRWVNALDDSVSDDEWDEATAALMETTNRLVPPT